MQMEAPDPYHVPFLFPPLDPFSIQKTSVWILLVLLSQEQFYHLFAMFMYWGFTLQQSPDFIKYGAYSFISPSFFFLIWR